VLDELKQYLRSTSWPILAVMLALMAVGVSAIRVAETAEAAPQGYANRQLWFAVAGLVVFFLTTLVPYQRVGRLAYVLFAVTLVLLVVVFIPSPLTGDRKGACRWIGVQAFSVQPSEVAKISFIVLLAWYLRSTEHYRKLTGLLVPFAMAVVPMALILKEPDLGTSLLFLPTLFIMLFMAGAKVRHLLGIVAIAAVMIFLPVPRSIKPETASPDLVQREALAYWHNDRTMLLALPLAYMEPHQLSRIDGWLRQDDPTVRKNKGYQLHQSIVILGAGGLTGRKGWYEADTFFRILPEDHTDFIFSVVGGQWGFAGCAAVLFLYAVIFIFGVEIATATNDAFGRMLAVGVLAMLFTQLVINVGMTMGLMPITGMTLPLISYGGSSLLVNCAALGLLVNVGQRRPRLLSRRPFEFGERQEKPVPFGPLAGK
jgi:rod shape-determining protein RodA